MTTSLTPLLVASDIDGTFIDSRERVTRRLREAVVRMLRHGTPLVLATGRPPRWLYPVVEQLPVKPLCVCANGALVYDSARDDIIFSRTLDCDVLHDVVRLARAATESIGGIGVAVERAGTSAHDPAEELFVVTERYDHAWESAEHGELSEDEVLAEPATKLLLRNSAVSSDLLCDLVAPVVDAEVAHVTYSMPDGLIEVSAPGVTKRAGLEFVADLVGAEPKDVVCFGDMPNDIEMVSWAGHGVAMGNAHDALKAAADEVTTSNDDDGVARVLERWF